MVEIINKQHKHSFNRQKIKKLVERLAARYRLGNPEVAVAFVGERTIRSLNRMYRKKDRPTDVLSFPLGKKGADNKFYLGDIVVSMPTAARQAAAGGHDLDRELEFLVLHGFLHLVGCNHGHGLSQEEKTVRRRLLGELS